MKTRPSHRLSAAALSLVLTLALGACKDEVAVIGQAAPALAALDAQGAPVRLEQWRGKVVYLNFWSTGCGYCLAEMPRLDALRQRYKDQVEVVAVNIDPDDMPIGEAPRPLQVSFPVLRDSMGITRDRYRVEGTPASFMIGADGVLRQSYKGARSAERLEMVFREAAQTLADGKGSR
ncbi:MAG: TlpA family protein disulfide reductase [Candidatus Accumulibacter sp.]|jgi:thiol-disulfide isomerase/thioredoxin|nr:TlpA family protein disulfide reductase [Accumulibacter sp.]